MIDRRHSRWFVSTLFFAIAFVVPPSARAADTLNICVEKKTSKLVARRSCRRGESRLSASSLLQRSSVSASADGQDGVDGSLRVYGNGSSGPLTVSADTDWSTTPPPSSISYFSDVTIAAGARLTVPSGYVFRCNGKIDISGSLVVAPSPSFVQSGLHLSEIGVNPGISIHAPQSQKLVETFTGFIAGSKGGRGLNSPVAAASIRPGLLYGGSSAPGATLWGSAGGGGVLFLLAKGPITIHPGGTINANGGDGIAGTGGGGGGVLVLASPLSINNFGTISAEGGKGSPATDGARKSEEDWFTDTGAGGGGGGGVIHFFSPVFSTGVTSVAGGKRGTGDKAGNPMMDLVTGGGGGGSYGDGGNGGGMNVSVGSTNLTTTAREAFPGVPGTAGIVIETPTDPTFSF